MRALLFFSGASEERTFCVCGNSRSENVFELEEVWASVRVVEGTHGVCGGRRGGCGVQQQECFVVLI